MMKKDVCIDDALPLNIDYSIERLRHKVLNQHFLLFSLFISIWFTGC